MVNQSSWYHKLFRKITGKHRYSYEINAIQFKYSDFGFYKELFFKEDNHNQVDALSPIINHVSITMSPKAIKKALGKPVLIVNISSKPKLQIFLYKLIRNGAKQKLYFHFFEDQLIVISKLFPFASNERVLELQNKHLGQYNLPKLAELHSEVSFQDKESRYLFLIKNLEYTEYLINPIPSFKDFLSTKFN